MSACSIKNYEHSEAKVIIIKTPKLKFSDLGYLKKSGDAVKIELFVAGKMVDSLSINHLVCVNEGCMSKEHFNKEYLQASYPDDLLQDIMLGYPIYDAKNIVKTKSGFSQEIQTQDVNIKYRVDAKQIYFKDRKNHILFKIKEIIK